MTDRYAVIGNPIGHTKSPVIHAAFAQASGQLIEYSAIESPLDGFDRAVHAFRDAGGRGMNITAPFKVRAYELAHERSERARRAGAANAIRFEAGRIHADNFDGVGLVSDIQRNLRLPMRGKRVLLLGAGGAARGILLPFLNESPRELVIANRTVSRALALAEQFGHPGNLRACGYGDIGDDSFDMVVNATSASLKGELPPVPASAFQPEGLAYELVYGKGMTPFLTLAKASGVERFADGVGMLVEQAAEAFLWWRGVRPDTRPVIEKLTVPLGGV